MKNFKIMQVKSKATGEIIDIKDYRFNSELHEIIEEGVVVKAEPKKRVVKKEEPKEEVKQEIKEDIITEEVKLD